MKTKTPYDPDAHNREAIANVNAQTAHWLKTFDEQVKCGVAEVLKRGGLDETNREKRLFENLTPRERLVKDIRDDARCIRSWYAWGEPTDYGKAICAKLRVEIRLRATVLIQARKIYREEKQRISDQLEPFRAAIQ